MNLTQEQIEKIKNFETYDSSVYEQKIIPAGITQLNLYTVYEKLQRKKLNDSSSSAYRYYYILVCNTCGEVRFVNCDDIAATKRCKQCNLNRHRQEFVGYENSIYKVIDFDHVAIRNNHRLFYKCICKNCGKVSILRKDSIIDAKGSKCSKCIGNNKIPGTSALYNIYKGHYKNGAVSRGLTWELTDDQFINIISKNCHYCGAEPIEIQSLKRYNKTALPFMANGIDRVDPNKDYTIDNCVPCCIKCNRMKLNYSYKEFLSHINKIYNFQKSATTIENTDISGSE